MALDEKTREKLKEPFGALLDSSIALQAIWASRPPLIIAVGDETIFRLLQNGVTPDIAAYDLKCKRKPVQDDVRKAILASAEKPIKVKSPAGEITRELSEEANAALLRGRGWIQIEGEDDLSALLFMARAQDGAVVLYGQPGKGMVWVQVNETVRGKARDFLIKMRE